jgi:hypothetical protein
MIKDHSCGQSQVVRIFYSRPDRLRGPPTIGTGNFSRVKWTQRDANPSSANVANGLKLFVRFPCVSAQTYHGVTFDILFSSECQQVGATKWHRCSYSRYLLSHLLRLLLPARVLNLSRMVKSRSLLRFSVN